jgi:hypothetical protein
VPCLRLRLALLDPPRVTGGSVRGFPLALSNKLNIRRRTTLCQNISEPLTWAFTGSTKIIDNDKVTGLGLAGHTKRRPIWAAPTL